MTPINTASATAWQTATLSTVTGSRPGVGVPRVVTDPTPRISGTLGPSAAGTSVPSITELKRGLVDNGQPCCSAQILAQALGLPPQFLPSLPFPQESALLLQGVLHQAGVIRMDLLAQHLEDYVEAPVFAADVRDMARTERIRMVPDSGTMLERLTERLSSLSSYQIQLLAEALLLSTHQLETIKRQVAQQREEYALGCVITEACRHQTRTRADWLAVLIRAGLPDHRLQQIADQWQLPLPAQAMETAAASSSLPTAAEVAQVFFDAGFDRPLELGSALGLPVAWLLSLEPWRDNSWPIRQTLLEACREQPLNLAFLEERLAEDYIGRRDLASQLGRLARQNNLDYLTCDDTQTLNKVSRCLETLVGRYQELGETLGLSAQQLCAVQEQCAPGSSCRTYTRGNLQTVIAEANRQQLRDRAQWLQALHSVWDHAPGLAQIARHWQRHGY